MTGKEKKTARIVGALFLIAMVTSLVGAAIIESNLTAPNYFADIADNQSTVIAGVLLEMIDGVAVIGIAVMMFPLFRKQDEALALGYVALRIIEAAIIFAAVISPITVIALSQEYSTAGATEVSYFQAVSASLIEVRAQLIGQVLGIVFSLAALVFYALLYQTRLVPRFISVWGLLAVALLLTWNLLELFGIEVSIGMILALPIILNEVFLGLWLILKGFSSPVTISEPAKVAFN